MPEGPECLIIASGINNTFKGQTLVDLDILGGRYLNKGIASSELVLGKTIDKVDVKGKLIYMVIEDNYLLLTLGMSGFITSSPEKAQVAFRTKGPRGSIDLYFHDPRHFGTIICGDTDYFQSRIKRIGPSILTPSFDLEWLLLKQRKVANTKSLIKFLMDQSICAGLGNYIKSESLHRAGINPTKTLKKLTTEEIGKLVEAIQYVANSSVETGGMSRKDYVDVEGRQGSYSEHLLVYGKDIDNLGRKVHKFKSDDDRTTWYVPEHVGLVKTD